MSFLSLSSFITEKTKSLSAFVDKALPGIIGDTASNIVDSIGQDFVGQVRKFDNFLNFGSNQTLASILSDPAGAIAAFAFSGFPGLIDPFSGIDEGPGSLSPNALHEYASFNTIFTLAALSVEELNFPDNSYRVNGPENIILKSGGGAKDKVITPFESKGRVEYYIDDVEIESIISPGSLNGTATAIGLKFTIFEPYSLGMFLQTIKIACNQAGHGNNHISAPMLLSMDFIGWDDDGNSFTVENSSRMIPFIIRDMQVTVNESGSQYFVEGVATNGEAMYDEIQSIKNDVSITGKDVLEILQTGPESLATKINERALQLEEDDLVSTADRVIISIPQNLYSDRFGNKTSFTQDNSNSAKLDVKTNVLAKKGSGRELANSAEINEAIANGSFLNYDGVGPIQVGSSPLESVNDVGFNQQRTDTSTLYVSGGKDSVISTIESDARTNVSYLGKFKLTKDFKDSGNVPFALPTVVHDAATSTNIRFDVNFQISEDKRKFTFTAGTKIETIIQNIILFSEYHEKLVDQMENPPENGMIDWFRIETCMYIIKDNKAMKRAGKYPRVYVYRVVPYQISHSKLKSPTAATKGLATLKANAVKQYQYIYTGQNKDILDFNLEFNYTFYQSVTPGFGNTVSGERKVSADKAEIQEVKKVKTAQAGNSSPVEGSGRTQEVNNIGGVTAGISAKSSIQQAAQDIHNAFLNNVELINLEMTILGDPFYIPDSGLGNFTEKNSSNFNIKRSGSLNYQEGEVLVNVIFKTPIDYNDNGSMDFLGATGSDGDIVEGFSGLYQVTQVTHLINQGLFTQKLNLLRYPNQTDGTNSDVAAVSKGNANTSSPIDQIVSRAGSNPPPQYIFSEPRPQ
jgi:hypothetical protein